MPTAARHNAIVAIEHPGGKADGRFRQAVADRLWTRRPLDETGKRQGFPLREGGLLLLRERKSSV
jgi:hypothetical protein